MSINTGGPAFPLFKEDMHMQQGMTLRDYFAAKAMQAIIAKHPAIDGNLNEDFVREESDATALGAYDYADAMLRAREAV